MSVISQQLALTEQIGNASDSPAQARFNTLVKRIEAERQRLSEWQTTRASYQQKFAAHYLPLLMAYRAARVQLIERLDDAGAAMRLSRHEDAKISHIIRTVALDMAGDDDDAQLRGLYERHGGQAWPDETTQVIEEAWQVPIEETPARTPRKSKKKQAAEAEQAAVAQQGQQSLREVYRKLAGALHPDREQDADARERKHALMQRVNVAYDRQDLLGLFELQLEVAQIDAQQLSALGEVRLQHYNTVLAAQLADLQRDCRAIEAGFYVGDERRHRPSLSPAGVLRDLQAEIRALQGDIAYLREELAAFRDDRTLKAWLKAYRMAADHED